MTPQDQAEEFAALLEELLTHDERGYGPWTKGMRRRVRQALNLETEPT